MSSLTKKQKRGGFFTNAANRMYLGIILLFLYAPIVLLMIFSFNESKSRAKWGGFSLKWYQSLFHNDLILNALKNTLLIALIASDRKSTRLNSSH